MMLYSQGKRSKLHQKHYIHVVEQEDYASFYGRQEHREIRIQPDFCRRKVPTIKDKTIDLRLREVDGEEGIFLCKKNYN